MMTDSGEAPEASHASHGGQAATGGAPAEYVAPLEPPEEIPEEDPPEPIDFDTADVEQLQAAVEARDAYISHLLRRLKNAVSYRMPPVDWRALENVPEDLQAKLGDLEQQLQEKLRITEVELSLERARMAREASRINQLNAQVQKHLERGGIAPGGADDDDLPEEKKGRRWLSMLGLNHEDED